MELFLEREVDFDRRCRFEDRDLDLRPDFHRGDLDPLEVSLLLDILLELVFLSLGLSFSVPLWTEFSILGIMSGKTSDVSLSSDFKILPAEEDLVFSLEGFDSDSDSEPDAEELSDREPDLFALSASLLFFFFFLFFFFPLWTTNKHRKK